MKCKKCKKTVSEDSLFCEHCGAKIEKPKVEIEDKTTDVKDIKKQIIDHLEFIGYEVKVSDAVGSYFCAHANKPNMIMSFRDDAGISFVVFYNIDSKKIEKNKALAYQYINAMNNKALLVGFSVNDDSTSLVCGGWYPNTYSKKTFANFLDYFEGDIRRALQLEGVMDVFG